jgi:serine/threonine protein phosphatase PrpC
MTAVESPISITAYGQSDAGLVRENNEDNFLIADLNSGITTADPAPLHILGDCLLLVADGMGGVEAGEVASRMAVELIAQYFVSRLRGSECAEAQAFVRILKDSIEEANQRVFEQAANDSRFKGMGTTLTAAAVYGRSIFFAQVGDSRAYLERNGSLTQMTQDQSLVAQLVTSGTITPEDAKAHPQRNVILQALGTQDHLEVTVSSAELRKADRVVLCSDGLWGKVEAEEVKEILDRRFDPKETCQRLIELARERGGEDNITIIVAHFDGDGLPSTTPDERPVYASFKDEAPRRFWPWRKS